MKPISQGTYQKLKAQYGKVANWAIWNPEDTCDLSVFEDRGVPSPSLRSDIVMIGLNASRKLKHDWENYHDCRRGSRDYYYRDCVQDFFRGAYMTDLVKETINPKSEEVRPDLERNFDHHAAILCEELRLLGADKNTHYIVIGRAIAYEPLMKHIASSCLSALMDPDKVNDVSNPAAHGLTKEAFCRELAEIAALIAKEPDERT